jgi:lycopene cyclase domain-containing protein
VLTAVFDNLMIGSGLMRYDARNITGVRLGVVPLEDFAYPIAGLLVLPALWILFRGRGTK